jgi:ABC-type spermidine/putrescine transport system permease subunit I
MTRARKAGLLFPAAAVLVLLLAVPMLLIADESFRLFVPGRVGAAQNAPLTWKNYAELLSPAYLRYFADTFRIGFIATAMALVIAYPIAYRVSHARRQWTRRAWLIFLVTMLFLSILVRVYAVDLAFGPAGFGRGFSRLLGVGLNSETYIEITIIIALLHCLIPMAALSLVGPLQSLNPHLFEAAQALGAAAWKAHATVTLPLSARGILAAFMLCFTFCLSAFVIPLVLGKGQILFVSNIIYSRFGEIGDYPSGAAISLVLLLLSLGVVYAITSATNWRWG